MGRPLILRDVDRRLIERIRERAAPLGLSAGEWARSLLIAQLGNRPAPVGELRRRKLIWGDNKLILSSLKSGPLREQIEEAGGLKLIYMGPPFDAGDDFSMDIEIGELGLP